MRRAVYGTPHWTYFLSCLFFFMFSFIILSFFIIPILSEHAFMKEALFALAVEGHATAAVR